MTSLFSVPEEGTLTLTSEEDTVTFGATLASLVLPGDVVALSGALGAGKTTLARGFIQHLTKTNEEIVSPTFTLVQTYESAKGLIWHFDLYRIDEPDDILELGLEEAQAGGISLIEWPERMGPYSPAAALNVEILSPSSGSVREIRVTGKDNWRDRLKELSNRVC